MCTIAWNDTWTVVQKTTPATIVAIGTALTDPRDRGVHSLGQAEILCKVVYVRGRNSEVWQPVSQQSEAPEKLAGKSRAERRSPISHLQPTFWLWDSQQDLAVRDAVHVDASAKTRMILVFVIPLRCLTLGMDFT